MSDRESGAERGGGGGGGFRSNTLTEAANLPQTRDENDAREAADCHAHVEAVPRATSRHIPSNKVGGRYCSFFIYDQT